VWTDRAVGEGAGTIRIIMFWSRVAPARRPAGFSSANPSSPGYDWRIYDQAVRELSSRGLNVLLSIAFAPSWAEGKDRPRGAAPGTWRPNPVAYANFVRAAAVRYSGRFPDPLHPGSFLPRVGYWQAWNEPNVPNDLEPQWIRSGSGYTAESPIIYRQLLNVFDRKVKGVSQSNVVVAGGTAPYGDPPGVSRMPPVQFDRGLFCLRDDSRLSPATCPNPPHLDALSHHPYGVSNPLWHAFNPDDAAPADMFKIARVLKAAERSHHVLPAGNKRLWVTETSWDSDPPDPNGIPVDRQALFEEQTMYVLWRQGVDTILWFQMVDSPPIPNYGSTVQGGTYYLDGRPKPSAQAFRFPFVTRRLNRGLIQAWGRAPEGGTLALQVLRRGRWKTVRRLMLKGHQVFQASVAIRGSASLRAQMPGQTSLRWTQGA
jgi:hypothetical protein